jgi:hypothetical protein
MHGGLKANAGPFESSVVRRFLVGRQLHLELGDSTAPLPCPGNVIAGIPSFLDKQPRLYASRQRMT